MKKTKLTQQVLMALLLGSSLLPGSMAQAAELTVTTDQSGNISLPGSGNTLTIESGTIDGYAYEGKTSRRDHGRAERHDDALPDGGLQNIAAGGTSENQILSNGVTQVMSGLAQNTTIEDGSTQQLYAVR